MGTKHVDGRILTPDGWQSGRLIFDAHIRAIEPSDDAGDERHVLPGFIDLHVHGGSGADCMAGEEATREMARFHAAHGTTSLLATTVTAPKDELRQALRGIAAVVANPLPGEAQVLGVHLEGPFLNRQALGAQPPFALRPDLDLVDELCGLAPVNVATIAPEIDPDHALLRRFISHGVRVQLGHSAGSYADAVAALNAGAAGFTHLFNAMGGFHHRRPGLVGAALGHAEYAEIIPDLVHVDAAVLRAALRAVPGLYAVTDAVAACGMPVGEYRLGRHRIVTDGRIARLYDGTLAGSVLTMDQALRNLLQLGLRLEQAAFRLATCAADYLGLEDRGRIAPGARADLVVVDSKGRLLEVYVGGEAIDITAGAVDAV